MAEPADLLNAWQETIRQLGRATASLTGAPGELADQLVGPLRRQGELLEQSLRRQADFERELVGRLLAPVTTVIDALEQTSAAMRTQAEAFSAASKAFQQASELVALQASLLERTTQSLRAPAELVRSVSGAQPGGGKPRKRKGASSAGAARPAPRPPPCATASAIRTCSIPRRRRMSRSPSPRARAAPPAPRQQHSAGSATTRTRRRNRATQVIVNPPSTASVTPVT